MDYLGENLLPGQFGHLLILFSFIASIGATVAYFMATQRRNTPAALQWRYIARTLFVAQSVCVVLVFALLFYIISTHHFEYKYAWQHSSKSLETQYLLACFWEGQEGSFLLWSFWHCVLGFIVMRRGKDWEAPVLTTVSAMQALIATMVLGVTVFGQKIGSNPFALLRNELAAPIFSSPAYLAQIKDGNDLNPLLQNYWMVIHPPVLFLGFASVLFPFAYAFGALWTRRYADWVRPVFPWTLFSAGILSTGIMMGAAWAYESLNFGGYWAWDPVENASLVPWLILVSGLHTLLIYKHTGRALRASFFFIILSLLFILYSTYLTKSGDLQDTSVHSFTDMGMKGQLRLFLAAFVVPSLVLLGLRYRQIPQVPGEEQTSSREFWMFIGSLVLFLSGMSIIAMTSLPVFNRILSLFTDEEVFKPLAFSEETAFAYNRIQVWVCVIVATLTAFTQYLKWKHSPMRPTWRKLIIPTVAALVLSTVIIYFGDINYREYGAGFMAAIWLAMAASVYAVVANACYIWLGIGGRLRIAGGSVAHLGFGLMLVGILVSSSKKEVLSRNTSGIFVPMGEGSKEKPGENLTLVKGLRTDMGSYWVTYDADSAHPKKPLWFYGLAFEDKKGKDKFTLQPNAFINYKGNEGLMANPDARHYWNYDIFTYISSLSNDPGKPLEDTTSFRSHWLKPGDSLFYSKGFLILESVEAKGGIPVAGFTQADSGIVATLKVYAKSESRYTVQPVLVQKGGANLPIPDTLQAESLVMQVQKREGNRIELGLKESGALMQYLTLKAYKFPFINLLWLGTLIMMLGFAMSTVRRIQQREPRIRIQKN